VYGQQSLVEVVTWGLGGGQLMGPIVPASAEAAGAAVLTP
jgi:hypothetical protein